MWTGEPQPLRLVDSAATGRRIASSGRPRNDEQQPIRSGPSPIPAALPLTARPRYASFMSGPRLLVLITIAIAAMCAAIVAAIGPGPEAAHAVVRWTARTSFVLFALTYVARPAAQLWPSPVTKPILARRKWIGLGFAVSHLAHLFGIIAIAWPDPAAFVRSQDPTIGVAVATFIVLFAMAITSIEAVKRRMPRRAWNGLHKTGIHLAWIPFAFTYIGLATGAPGYIVPAVLVIAIAVVRGAAFVRARRRAAAHKIKAPA